MFKNYFKIAWRNLRKNKIYSLINILGLASGLAIALLIGLWIWDEMSFNKNFDNYDRLVTVLQTQRADKEIVTYPYSAYPLAAELRGNHSAYFKQVAITRRGRNVLMAGEQKLSKDGLYAQHEFTGMFSLPMLEGNAASLEQPNNLLVSASLAKALFGNADPVGQAVRVNNKRSLQVSGVYKDFPANSSFAEITYLMPWENIMQDKAFTIRDIQQNIWDDNSFILYAQLQDGVDLEKANANISHVLDKRGVTGEPVASLHPMARWHLYNQFKNGVNTGGAIQFVWMFGIIGAFVLLLACINFMNLSTARSEKRAREVGIRKAAGSLRSQLMAQFLLESVMLAILAMALALALVCVAMPWFNTLAGKDMQVLWTNGWFWTILFVVTTGTGLVAGSYPAFYLSAFNTVKVLKGTFKAGRQASLPRRILVVLQFTISVTMVIGTVIIYQQIRYTQTRPLGYSRDGLLRVNMNTPDLYGKYDVLRQDLLNTGAVVEMAESSSPTTNVLEHTSSFTWDGMQADMSPSIGVVQVTREFGNTVGWKMDQGRDFSRAYTSDDHALILNEAAVKYMNLQAPLGKTVRFTASSLPDKNFHVIGVVKDVLQESPFEVVKPVIYLIDPDQATVILVRLNPQLSAHEAMPLVENVFRKYNPNAPFDYAFANEEFAAKFRMEERIGSLAAVFAGFAVFISCLGLFGLAAFVAMQRTKEIGVRKVLGASVLNVWGLLSKDFVLLVLLASVLAVPVAYLGMHTWLAQYEYHTPISMLVFITCIVGALLITLLTVSFQAIRAATINPVRSLRAE